MKNDPIFIRLLNQNANIFSEKISNIMEVTIKNLNPIFPKVTPQQYQKFNTFIFCIFISFFFQKNIYCKNLPYKTAKKPIGYRMIMELIVLCIISY